MSEAGGIDTAEPFAVSPLPTALAIALARSVAFREATASIEALTWGRPMDGLRDLGGSAWAPLRTWPFVALAGMSAAFPDIEPARLARCLGLNSKSAPDLLAHMALGADWPQASVDRVTAALTQPPPVWEDAE